MNFDVLLGYHRRTGRTTRMLEAAIEYWKKGKSVCVLARGNQVEFLKTRLEELGYTPQVDAPRIVVRPPPDKFDYDNVSPHVFVDHYLFERRVVPLMYDAERWNLQVDRDVCRSKFEARRKYNSQILFRRDADDKYSDNGVQREWELWQEAWEAATNQKV